ncbi:MAG: hypothetical protein G01um10147_630 [Microgenomates group bacterium Gr01-1014_7]|nr:MAG: hypothetical protein G01um10147_630 [Microgenomates group bacterium Gr01-1014_7]
MAKFTRFARIAEVEFSGIVLSTQDLGHKLRIYLTDKSFIDFFYTTTVSKLRFSIHWERNHIDNLIYRLDNTPDKKWSKVSTFPLHFHSKQYENVNSPSFQISKSDSLENLLRKFLSFAKDNIV